MDITDFLLRGAVSTVGFTMSQPMHHIWSSVMIPVIVYRQFKSVEVAPNLIHK